MNIKEIVSVLVFINILLALVFSEPYSYINITGPPTGNYSEDALINFNFSTPYIYSAKLEWQRVGGSWFENQLECSRIRPDGTCRNWGIIKTFTPGKYQFKGTMIFGNSAKSSQIQKFTILGEDGLSGQEDLDFDDAQKEETFKEVKEKVNGTSSENTTLTENNKTDSISPEIPEDQKISGENLEGGISEDIIIQEGPNVDIAPSGEKRKKGICGPSMLLILSWIPIVLSRYRK